MNRLSKGLGLSMATFCVVQACVTELGSWSAADINDGAVIVGTQKNASGEVHAVIRMAGGELKELPNFPGDTASEAVAISNRGVVLGNATSPAGRHPVMWSADGRVRSLGQLGGRDTRALAMNNSEIVVGTTAWPIRAWLYDPVVGVIDTLPVPFGDSSTEATAINDNGEIAGTAAFLTGVGAIKWSAGAHTVSFLPVPNISDHVNVWGINSAGSVVGSYDYKPVLWEAGATKMVFLPTGDWPAGKANAINDDGVIVGKVMADPAAPDVGAGGVISGKAALWGTDRQLVDLDPDGVVGPSIASEARAINASGAVVGNKAISPENPAGRAVQFR